MMHTKPAPDAALERSVIEILAAQALREPDGLRLSDKVEDLGLDSLGMAEVIFAIEERFDITIPLDGSAPDETRMDGRMNLSTVGGVVAAVATLVTQPAT